MQTSDLSGGGMRSALKPSPFFTLTYPDAVIIKPGRRGDCNIWELSKRLGHKSIKITERYPEPD